ncbi:galactose-binding domain-like protein [Melampsora americana]|nr:galactose-binding domain-like protein [Melampsora americana]
MSTNSYRQVKLDEFEKEFNQLIELSSQDLGSSIVAVSDEWFAPAKCLINPKPAQAYPGQFGPNGALYDGWESRRHNALYDWVIIRLGVSSATIEAFDLDTTHFSGNEAPACCVFGLPISSQSDSASTIAPSADHPQWQEVLPTVPLGPSSRHLFKINETTETYRYLKLHMIPDGGLARFRVYGHPIPIFPENLVSRFDLASALLGAQVVLTSNQHYGVGSNLILPGRGPESMDGGWETRRSRKPGHSDHVIIKLSTTGYLDYTEIDTNYFIGNFPQEVDLNGTNSDQLIPSPDAEWVQILPKTKLGPHQQQYFQLSRPNVPLTHVKMTIYPDGGIKRVRLFGRRSPSCDDPLVLPNPEPTAPGLPIPFLSVCPSKPMITVPVLPLTRAAFAPFGSTIEAHDDPRTWPPSIQHKTVNFGCAEKYCDVAQIESLKTPTGILPKSNLCIFSSQPWPETIDGESKRSWKLKGLERHPYSSQSFIPLTPNKQVSDSSSYLVVVGSDNGDGKPDWKNLRAFLAQSDQGITYKPNTWHAPLIAIKKPMDFACIVNETGIAEFDCELVECEGEEVVCELD